ncbi:hypothetical protein BGX26_004293, partial [Mortierella sp. AD094]
MTDINQDDLPHVFRHHVDGVSGTITSLAVTESQDSDSGEHAIPLNELARDNSSRNSRNSVHAVVDTQEAETETESSRTINSPAITAAASSYHRDHPETLATETEPTKITAAPITTTEQDNTVPECKNSGDDSNNQAQNSTERYAPSVIMDGYTATSNRDNYDMEDDYNKGFACFYAEGVAQDYPKAFEYFHKAAKQGHVDAHHKLGYMYDHGKGVGMDHAKALEWYQRVADNGYAKSQYNLGIMYEQGQGLTRDFSKAAEWYQKSADQGYQNALNRLGFMYHRGHGVTQNINKAVECYETAANLGNTRAQCNLGNIYLNGRGATKNPSKAV